MFSSKSLLGTALAALSYMTAPISAECTREGLLAAADSYIAAVTSGNIDGLKLSTSNFTYKENNEEADITSGVLSQPLEIDLSRSTADTVACASYTMIISAGGPKPYVLATQIRHPGDDTSTITMIDTIAATTGSLFFNAQKTLEYIQKQNWEPIPEAERPSRELLKRFGDAYLDMWTDPEAADSIAWGEECERVEGSQYTNPCGALLPRGGSARNNGNRRYVIDETVGSVDILCSFDALGSLPDSHELRIEGGKVRYVHTVTV
ncbi:hypothetical protein MMYC01_207787 [Madurella mycetomatis]|uniref:DUF8021 domain-containing protein n=1 Tax=Madurella mycetomatis TaxID=100816 RepID=A0A175VX77_9PEZI|nr:hypothetical protein MMYC01_209490 [Madurella mycetomatis]KXX75791.1 hypothetical protein MMYC01_207787 [Madurella mycetomatis]